MQLRRKTGPRDHAVESWLVVLSAFFVFLIVDGLIFSFGILLVEIVEQFQTERAPAGVVISIQFGILNFIGPLTGALVELYGCRILVIIGATISCVGFVFSYFVTNVYHLWITYGILGRLGFGLMYMPTAVCVLTNLKKHRTLGIGVAKCGSGLGTIIFNQLTRLLIQHVGLRGTILIEAGIVLHGAVFGLFLVLDTSSKDNDMSLFELASKSDQSDVDEDVLYPLPEEREGDLGDFRMDEKSLKETKKSAFENKSMKSVFKGIFKSMFDWKLMSDVRLILILLSSFIKYFGYGIPFNLLPDQVIENGMTKKDASWLMSTIGIANTASRIVFGWIGDLKCVNRLHLCVILLFLTGAITALSPFLTTFATKMIYVCMFGTLIGGFNVIFNVALPDIFGDKLIARTNGLVMFTCGIAGCVSTPIGGFMFDYTGNYTLSFIFSGAVFIISGLLLGLSKVYEIIYMKEDRKIQKTNIKINTLKTNLNK
ncbi:hypothetical protein ACF0H5_023633 [Mactra antiquata]